MARKRCFLCPEGLQFLRPGLHRAGLQGFLFGLHRELHSIELGEHPRRQHSHRWVDVSTKRLRSVFPILPARSMSGKAPKSWRSRCLWPCGSACGSAWAAGLGLGLNVIGTRVSVGVSELVGVGGRSQSGRMSILVKFGS